MKYSIKSLVIAAALVFSILPSSANAITQGATTNISPKAPKYFLIGVWAQPPKTEDHTDNFGFWKDLGVNTLIGHDNGPQKNITEKQWDAAAAAKGLKVVRMPSNDIAYDRQQFKTGNLVAWMHPDENDKIAANKGKWDESTLNEAILNPAKSMRAKAPEIPIFANFIGSQFGYNRDNWYRRAVLEGTDFYSFDWYPINTGYYMDLNMVTQPQKILSWTGRNPIFYIETSDQHLKKFPGQDNPAYASHTSRMRGPLPWEIKGEMAIAVAQGAPGIIFFADSFYPFHYDATTPDGAAMIKQELKTWSKLTADPGAPISGLPDGLVGQRRLYDGSYKKIVANYTYNTIKVGNYTFAPLDYKILNDNEQVTGTVTVIPGQEPKPSNSGNSNTGGSNNGGSNNNNNNSGNATTTTKTLDVTCKVNKTEATTKQTVVWSLVKKGGKYPYSYSWEGNEIGTSTSSSLRRRFSEEGTKSVSVTVKSKDGQTDTVDCPDVVVTEPEVLVSCSARVSRRKVDSAYVSWSARTQNAGRTIEYSWDGTDDATSTRRSFSKKYTTPGIKEQTITINTGSTTKTATCSADVTFVN